MMQESSISKNEEKCLIYGTSSKGSTTSSDDCSGISKALSTLCSREMAIGHYDNATLQDIHNDLSRALKNGNHTTVQQWRSVWPQLIPAIEKELASRALDFSPIPREGPSDQWHAEAYPLQQLTVLVQGTRHATAAELASHLEAVAAKIRNGKLQGVMHEEDSGYSFLHVVSPGPSIFG